jgi:hypothetical protein
LAIRRRIGLHWRNGRIPMRVSRQIRQRLELIAFERGIDQGEVGVVLRSGQRLVEFARQYGLSMDWLLLGDLPGQRQTHARKRNAG